MAGSPQPGTPEPEPSGSASPSPSGKATPSGKAAPKKASDPKVNKATPNPRPAPFATPRPDSGPTPARPTAPRRASPTASADRQITQKGASVDDPLAWSQDPGIEWLQKFATFKCPPKGEDAAPVADDADEPLIACNDKGLKFLLSKALIEGTELKSASYGTPQNGVGWAVNLGFKSSARKVFGDTTTALNQNGGTFAIVLDGKRHLLRRRQRADPRRQRARSPVTSRSPRRDRCPTR